MPAVREEAYDARRESFERVELRDDGEAQVSGMDYDSESGELLLRTQGGESVPVSKAELTTEQEELIGTLRDVLGPEQAAHAFNIMERGQDAGSFAKAYGLVRNVFGRACATWQLLRKARFIIGA